MQDIRQLKSKIRAWRKIKRNTRVGTQQRRDINNKLRELQEKLDGLTGEKTPEKEKLVKEILKVRPYLEKLRGFDFYRYTVEQLQKHLENIKRGK